MGNFSSRENAIVGPAKYMLRNYGPESVKHLKCWTKKCHFPVNGSFKKEDVSRLCGWMREVCKTEKDKREYGWSSMLLWKQESDEKERVNAEKKKEKENVKEKGQDTDQYLLSSVSSGEDEYVVRGISTPRPAAADPGPQPEYAPPAQLRHPAKPPAYQDSTPNDPHPAAAPYQADDTPANMYPTLPSDYVVEPCMAPPHTRQGTSYGSEVKKELLTPPPWHATDTPANLATNFPMIELPNPNVEPGADPTVWVYRPWTYNDIKEVIGSIPHPDNSGGQKFRN